jgi:hypothetical protein
MSAGWPDQITTPRVCVGRPRFSAPSGEHDIGENRWIGVQPTDDGRDVHRGDIPNPSAYGLCLNVEMWLGGIAGVSDIGNLLADLDLITDLDFDAAWPEMAHQQEVPATDVDHDVVAALVAAVCRSDCLVRPAINNGSPVGGTRAKIIAATITASHGRARASCPWL